ncbi:GNAT family N-acetyltransferase, partial [Streptomyces niveus]
MEIRRATTVAELVAAQHLYDGPARPEWAER